LNETELEILKEQVNKYKGHVMVGFNRRFAPLLQMIKSKTNQENPVSIHYRINAGQIAADHWTQNPSIGGGRIIGEVCHFIDLCAYISNSKIKYVSGFSMLTAGNTEDTVTINLVMENGSIANICYYANGSKELSKERIEVYNGGNTYILDDFKTLKSAIGYLLSDYKSGGASKMVLFQDRYLDNVSRQGGNGKTLIVNSLMRLRKGVKLSANRCNVKGDKFVFQEVNLGDKIVFLDEIMDSDFLGNLFNEINNFLPVQKKYQDQFRLEGQNLPKMVGCSNYMIWKPQEISQSRRIYCQESDDTWVYKCYGELVDSLRICMCRVSALFEQLDGPDFTI
jgi:hypothetical protein